MLENRPPTIVQETRSHPEPYHRVNQPSSTYDASGATTDEQLIAMWLSGRPATTVRAYSSDVAKLKAHVHKPIRQLTARDLLDWAETLARLKPASQYRSLSAIKSLFSYAMALGYIRLDPAAAIRMPRSLDDRASKLLSVEAVQAILAGSSGRTRLLLRTLYLLGLRESELIALRPEDIRENTSGFAVSVTGKGGKLRYLACPARLARDLLAHCQSGPIFQLDPSTVYRTVRAAGESAGYRISPHSLRHSHASHAIDAGASLTVVRDSLGHSSLATTSIYAHCRPSDGASLYLEDDL